MDLALLVDIGSTYTKASVVDLDKVELKAQAKALTTVWNDVTIGIKEVLNKLEESGIDLTELNHRLACSSAAGGLRLIAIGLVPSLTAEAAKRAALGAGAKVVDTYSYELSQAEIAEIERRDSDLILLAGGTDGGNKEIILKNAKSLAQSELKVPIIVAGNKSISGEVVEILTKANKEVYQSENVMPKLEELNIEPTRKLIRKLFLEQIIYAKGLAQAREYVGEVKMPTPSAVRRAAKLLAKGSKDLAGLGELLIVDIGGATTDIHSAAKGAPTKSGVSLRGLTEPYLKRTVEGDLGMRYSAKAVVELVGTDEVLKYCQLKASTEQLLAYLEKISQQIEYVAQTDLERDFDNALAKLASKLAIKRHVGRIERVYGPMGQSYIQYGKDLTELDLIIGTGGILIDNPQAEKILQVALFKQNEADVLAPKVAELILDQDYILAAVGLLSRIDQTKALKLAKKSLEKIN